MVREKKFTKGPWIVGCNLQGVMVGHKDDAGTLLESNWHHGGFPKAICKFVEKIPKWMGGGHKEKRANANLIAAAPELLDALEKMLDGFGNVEYDEKLFDLAESAIAKAYGEQP